jgi:large subunit ribosomal protein L15
MSTTIPRPGARHRRKRLGSGESSGKGKTSGKGHKGQKARSGGSLRLGFEGGQMPLIRRIPKRGFNNAVFTLRFAPVNLSSLDLFSDGSKVDEASLRQCGLVKGEWEGVKILGGGKLKPKNLVLEVHAASESAKSALEAAGAKITLLKK